MIYHEKKPCIFWRTADFSNERILHVQLVIVLWKAGTFGVITLHFSKCLLDLHFKHFFHVAH